MIFDIKERKEHARIISRTCLTMLTSTMHALGRLRDLRFIMLVIFVVNVVILINSSILLSTTHDTSHDSNSTLYDAHCCVPYNNTQRCSTEYFVGHFDDKRLSICEGSIVRFRYYVNDIASNCAFDLTEYEWDSLLLFVKSITTDLQFTRFNHSVPQ